MVLGGPPIPCNPEGPRAVYLCHKNQIPSKRFVGGSKNSASGRTPHPHKCSGSSPQELALKKIKTPTPPTTKVTNSAAKGLTQPLSWSLPLLFCRSRNGEALSGVWSAKMLQALPPFLAALLWRQGFFLYRNEEVRSFYTGGSSCPNAN